MTSTATIRRAEPPPQISSIGLPPEKHADRVVAAMMRHLVEQRGRIGTSLTEVLCNGFLAGSPRAQMRLAERFKKAGAINVKTTTGKKGRYSIGFLELSGWDPARDDYIETGDVLPEKPWLVCYMTIITNPGRLRPPEIRNVPILYITHHVLSRSAQRLGLRTTKDLQMMCELATMSAMAWIQDNGGRETIDKLPAAGVRIVIGEGTAMPITLVFQRHESRSTLVATTAFGGGPCHD